MTLEAARKRDNGGKRHDGSGLLQVLCRPRCAAASPIARSRSTAARATWPDSPIERFYRDVRLFRLYEGTSQIQQLVIARHMIRNASR